MIALDSSAIVAIALREPEASVFLDAILSNPVLVGTPTLLETRIVLTKRKVRDPRHAVSLILGIAQSIVVPFDEKLLEQASEAFLTYGKGRHPARLNYGDCMAYAVAKALDVPLLYKGDDFTRTDIRSAL